LTLGGNRILDGVDFTIKNVVRPDVTQGQVVGLLGPSGIGKTQLFRILAGLNPPDKGEVLIGDPGEPVRAGRVGVVAQHYPLFAHRTVLDNLVVAGMNGGKSGEESRAKAEALLDRFHMLDRKGLYPAQLSGGQRQRVAIAQQIMCSEQFLLMDEPFSGLDLIALRRVQELIVEIGQLHELNTIFVVTHDISAAVEICDTILLMGRNSDTSGKLVPGAKIQATYDLIERGLAWRPNVSSLPEFNSTLQEIRQRFTLL
jgi:polar amino acid transport system ATP-binding protein/sulfate transport system ATP-binding protein